MGNYTNSEANNIYDAFHMTKDEYEKCIATVVRLQIEAAIECSTRNDGNIKFDTSIFVEHILTEFDRLKANGEHKWVDMLKCLIHYYISDKFTRISKDIDSITSESMSPIRKLMNRLKNNLGE